MPAVVASLLEPVTQISSLMFSAGGVIGTGLFVGSAVRVLIELEPITAMCLFDGTTLIVAF